MIRQSRLKGSRRLRRRGKLEKVGMAESRGLRWKNGCYARIRRMNSAGGAFATRVPRVCTRKRMHGPRMHPGGPGARLHGKYFPRNLQFNTIGFELANIVGPCVNNRLPNAVLLAHRQLSANVCGCKTRFPCSTPVTNAPSDSAIQARRLLCCESSSRNQQCKFSHFPHLINSEYTRYPFNKASR